MLTIFILLILAWQFYIGYARGLVLQLAYLAGSVLSLVTASLFYRSLADWLYYWVPYASPTEGASTYFFDSRYLFELDKVFYAGLAFFVIYLLTYAVLRFFGIFLHLFPLDSLDKLPWGKYLAGGLSVLVTWIGLAMVLTILTTIPVPLVQDSLNQSLLAKGLIYTPVLAQFLQNLWLTSIVG